jgi:branched-chain amino acid transport system substrate-binding protein
MTSKWIRTAAAIAALVLTLGTTACGSDDEKTSGDGAAAKQTVKVGGIFDLSGATADVGTPYAAGIKGFVKDWNDQGDGPTIELSSEDYKYDVAVAERLYSRLKSEGVVAVQGWGTGDTEALRGRVTADRVPFMSASYAETLTDPSQTPFNFVTATSYSDQMRLALQWISEKAKGAQVASFHHDSPFGESPQKAGTTKAKQLGVGFKSYAMPAEATDYVPQLRRAKAQGAKFVVIQNVSTPAAQLAKNIAEQGLDMQIVCLNWCGDELFLDLAGDAAEGTVGVMPFAPASAKADGLAQPRDFLAKSGGSLDKQGLHYVQGWYTMGLMAEGIKLAASKGKVTGDSIKQALEEMDAFDTGGVSATVDFTATSHAGMKGSKLYEAKDGTWTELTELLSVS